jgi:hypothetical protein
MLTLLTLGHHPPTLNIPEISMMARGGAPLAPPELVVAPRIEGERF